MEGGREGGMDGWAYLFTYPFSESFVSVGGTMKPIGKSQNITDKNKHNTTHTHGIQSPVRNTVSTAIPITTTQPKRQAKRSASGTSLALGSPFTGPNYI